MDNYRVQFLLELDFSIHNLNKTISIMKLRLQDEMDREIGRRMVPKPENPNCRAWWRRTSLVVLSPRILFWFSGFDFFRSGCLREVAVDKREHRRYEEESRRRSRSWPKGVRNNRHLNLIKIVFVYLGYLLHMKDNVMLFQYFSDPIPNPVKSCSILSPIRTRINTEVLREQNRN